MNSQVVKRAALPKIWVFLVAVVGGAQRLEVAKLLEVAKRLEVAKLLELAKPLEVAKPLKVAKLLEVANAIPLHVKSFKYLTLQSPMILFWSLDETKKNL